MEFLKLGLTFLEDKLQGVCCCLEVGCNLVGSDLSASLEQFGRGFCPCGCGWS